MSVRRTPPGLSTARSNSFAIANCALSAMGWLDHDRLGFNYRLSDIACALGIAQLERLGEMLWTGSRGRLVSGGSVERRGVGVAVCGQWR